MKIARLIVILAMVSLAACSKKGGGGGAKKQSVPTGATQTRTSAQDTPEQAKARAQREADLAKSQKDAEAERAKLTAAAAQPVAPVSINGGYEARLGGKATGNQLAAAPETLSQHAEAQARQQESVRLATTATNNDGLPIVKRSGQTSSSGAIQSSYSREDIVTVRDSNSNLAQAQIQSGYSASDLRTSGAQGARNGEVQQQQQGVGPGYPKGYAPSEAPLVTGMVDAQGQAFTDNKNDSIMAVLVQRMNEIEQSNAQMREESQQLADSMREIELYVDRQTVELTLSWRFSDREISESFSGFLQSGRTAMLSQRTNNSGEQFQVQVICADADNNCRNAILKIEQIKDGQVCRRIYAVHRWMMDGVGDGHFTISNEDYQKAEKIHLEDKEIFRATKAGKKYDKELVVKNRAARGFIRLVGNTAHYNRMLFKEIPKDLARTPRLGFLGVRSWAVAYGPSFFEISMSKLSSKREDVGMVRFAGALKKPRFAGEIAENLNVAGQFSNAITDDYTDENIQNIFKRISVVDNDGRGQLTLDLELYGEASEGGNARLRVNFTSLRVPSVDDNQLQQLVQ